MDDNSSSENPDVMRSRMPFSENLDLMRSMILAFTWSALVRTASGMEGVELKRALETI